MRPALLLLAAGLLLALPLLSCAQANDATTVVLVVRHAEKAATPADDPGLTEAGLARTRALIDAAGDAGVSAIYSSQFKRTLDTVAPLAARLGLPVTTFPIDGATMETYPQRLAEAILEAHRGRTVLIVNHSNTVPAIVEALGGGPVAPMTEAEYDHLFVVIIPPEGPARTLRTRFGR